MSLLLSRAVQIAEPASAAAVTAPRGTGATLRLLLVDDSVDAATLLSMVLEADGYDVRVAHEAKHALEVAAHFKPEIVLLDLSLPGMDGFQLAQEMRRQASTANAL